LKPLDEEERRVTARQAASPLKRLEDEEREDARRRETVRVGVRLSAMGVVVLALFSIMVFRLWSLQVLNSSSARQTVLATTGRNVPIAPPRGLIEARGGQVLVSNEVQPVVTLSRQVAARDPGVLQRLAILLGLSVKDIDAAINNQQDSIYQPVPIALGVSGSVIVYLSEHRAMFPGVTVSYVAERRYPDGTLASQALGYVSDITAQELGQLRHQGYTQGDVLGQSGVEAAYEQYLRGHPGTRRLLVDAAGDPVGTSHITPAQPGNTVVLNLDLGLQQAAESTLQAEIAKLNGKAQSGAVVALDPRNGQILAMASWPTYNPSWWVGGMSTAHYQQLTSASSNYPLLDRVTQGQYPPGSTFKLATATAALDTGLISPYTYINDPGQFVIPGCQVGCVFHNNESESCGACDVETALTISDDVFFYTLGYRFYVDPQAFGNNPIQRYAEAYGLGVNTGADLPGALPGQVDSPQLRVLQHEQAPKVYLNTSYSVGDAINTAFGQGETVVTPLELANAYATFANGGTRYAPQIGAEIVSPTGKVLKTIEPKVMGHVSLPPATRQAIETGLEGVTTDPKGTATPALAQLHYPYSQLPIAGKTGTAQSSSNANVAPDSLFVAYGPVGAPRYVIACIIPNGGYGSDAAAPVVVKLFEYLIAHPVGAVTPKAVPGAG
jgi:penicillin-binding protein 2